VGSVSVHKAHVIAVERDQLVGIHGACIHRLGPAINIWDRGKEVIINNVELGQDMPSLHVANTSNIAGVLPRDD
jgi:hypothetical protein